MTKKILLTVFSLVVFIGAFSQSEESKQPGNVFVRFNFLGLLDVVDQNLSTGIEYRFRPQWSTGSDVAWIFNSRYFYEGKSANGFLVRPFIRYYPRKNGVGFLEAELHYKFVSYKIEDWVGRNPVNGVPSYQEFARFNYNKDAIGIHFKGGTQVDLSRDKRLRLEFIFGIGVRWKWQGAKNVVYENFGWELDNQNRSFPVVPCTIRLIYSVK